MIYIETQFVLKFFFIFYVCCTNFHLHFVDLKKYYLFIYFGMGDNILDVKRCQNIENNNNSTKENNFTYICATFLKIFLEN